MCKMWQPSPTTHVASRSRHSDDADRESADEATPSAESARASSTVAKSPPSPASARGLDVCGPLDEEAAAKLSHMEFHGKLKTASLRARAERIEQSMSAEERERVGGGQRAASGTLSATRDLQESELKARQMEEIFKLMQDEGGKFGFNSKAELMEQMKMYA